MEFKSPKVAFSTALALAISQTRKTKSPQKLSFVKYLPNQSTIYTIWKSDNYFLNFVLFWYLVVYYLDFWRAKMKDENINKFGCKLVLQFKQKVHYHLHLQRRVLDRRAFLSHNGVIGGLPKATRRNNVSHRMWQFCCLLC